MVSKKILTLINVSGQLLLSLCPAYNILQARTNTRGLPLLLNAAPCSLFNKVHRVCVTVSWANMFGRIFVKYSILMQRIGSGFERCDLRSLIDPVRRPSWKKQFDFKQNHTFLSLDVNSKYPITLVKIRQADLISNLILTSTFLNKSDYRLYFIQIHWGIIKVLSSDSIWKNKYQFVRVVGIQCLQNIGNQIHRVYF